MRHLVLLCLLVCLSSGTAYAQDELIFVIRVDDIQSRSTITSRSLESFEESVAERGGRITWGVIPHRLIEAQNTDGVLASTLKASSAGGHEIALHGYTHICARCGQSSHEMYCTRDEVPYSLDEQRALIARGMVLLEEHIEVVPRAFIPPGHAMDGGTLSALFDEGLGVISTTETHATHLRPGVFNVAPTKEYTWVLKEEAYEAALVAALNDVRDADGYFGLLLHDPFVREGYEDGLVIRWTAELLDSLNAEFGAAIQYMTVSEAADHLQATQSSAARYAEQSTIRLEGNSPNPFGGSTQIRFHLADPAHVLIEVYDLLGRKLERIVDERFEAGRHQVKWVGNDLPAGAYPYRLAADGQQLVDIMTVAR